MPTPTPLPELPARYRIPRVFPYARLTLLWLALGLALGFATALLKLAYVAPILLATFAWFTYRRIRITRASHAIRDFLAPTQRGDIAALAVLSERVVPLAHAAPALLAIVVMTRAYAYLRQGDPAMARALYAEVERTRWLARTTRHPQLSFFYRNAALSAALTHDPEEATRLHALATTNTDPRDPTAQIDLTLCTAILALHANRPTEALEAIPPATSSPPLRLLRAFAISRTTSAKPAEDLDTEAAAWLTPTWPELQTFLHSRTP